MNQSASPVCFHCGQPTASTEEGPRLNRLPDGQPCPACADRLLQSLPSLVGDVAQEMESMEQLEFEGLDDSFLPDEPA